MATTKTSRSTASRAKSATSRARSTPARATSTSTKSDSLAARTGRTIKNQPYTSAAIATGAVTAIAAAAAGAFFFSRRDKSFKETAGDVQESLSGMGDRLKDGLSDAREKASAFFDKARSQREISEEALSLKQTGDMLDEQSSQAVKTGAVAY